MSFVAVRRESGIATVVLERGKVNAPNPAVVEELSAAFAALQGDAAARAVILTGSGRSSVFAGRTEMLKSRTEPRAGEVLYSGAIRPAFSTAFPNPSSSGPTPRVASPSATSFGISPGSSA